MADLRDVLETAAKNLRKPVRPCELYDPNVCEFRIESGWHPVAINGFPFSRHLALVRSKRKVSIFANQEFVLIEIKGDRPGPAFCIGHADRINFWQESTRYVLGAQDWPVYVRSGTASKKDVERALNSKSLQAAVANVLGANRARLHLHIDEVRLYFQPLDATTLISAVASLLPLTGPAKGKKLPAGTRLVPKDLRKLLPLISRWAEPDDLDRVTLLENGSRRSLEKLVGAVKPHLQAIDTYLGSFGDNPIPEIATLLGTLAECAIEAELLLAKETQE
jgi:hypothetical protein